MSVAGDIVTALLADIAAAISGVTTSVEAISVEEINSEDLPYAMVLQTDYEPEVLEYGQELRVWTITGLVVQDGGTREQVQTKLEAIQTQLAADPTLGGAVDHALLGSSVPSSHPDAKRLYGAFVISAQKVV